MKRYGILVVAAVLVLGAAGAALAQRAGDTRERFDDDRVITVEGTLADVDRPLAELETGDESYVVHLGPRRYWERMGYEIEKGDRVIITGQVSDESGTHHLYLHSMERGDRTYEFADENGVPHWRQARKQGARAGCAGAGPGRGRGRGAGDWGDRDRRGGGHGHRHHHSRGGDCPRR